MSIAKKVLLFMSLMVGIFLATDFFIQRYIIYPTFRGIEHGHAKANVRRIEALLEDNIDQLDRNTYDWSAWDDTYRFIADRNQTYIDSNLQPDTYWNLEINLVYFLNTAIEPVWAQMFEFDDEAVEVVTKERYVKHSLEILSPRIKRIDESLEADEQYARGIFVQDGTPILYAVRPILTSAGQGPARGYLVQGRIINQRLLNKFRKNLELDFQLDTIPPERRSAIGEDTSPYSIKYISDETLEISRLYHSNGEPVLKISTTFPRDITLNGLTSIHYALGTFFIIGVLSIVFIWALLRVSVFTPIARLTRQIQSISENRDYSLRSDIKSGDEIGTLAREFNSMLSILQASHSELSLANSKLEQLSVTDPLTGIANRLSLENKLAGEWEVMKRESAPLAVLMIDIDYFKAFNDNYGHQAGDQCLRKVANIISHSLRRPGDLAARYGGEEFMALLPRSDCQAAENVANNIRSNIASARIEHRFSEVGDHLSVSIGLACAIPSPESSPEQLIDQADAALYRAKRRGRDRIVVAG